MTAVFVCVGFAGWRKLVPRVKVAQTFCARNCFSLHLILLGDTYIVKPGHFVRRRVGRDGAFKVNVVTLLQVIEV